MIRRQKIRRHKAQCTETMRFDVTIRTARGRRVYQETHCNRMEGVARNDDWE